MEPLLPRIDLHMHSKISDGTDAPAELLNKVRSAGLGVFSLTDHDAIRGCTELQGLLEPGDPRFLTGVEFSCRDRLGKYHILGYGYDPAAPSIGAVVELGHSYRMTKLGKRLTFLEEAFGFRLPGEAVERLYTQPNPGKPHIANLLVKYGFVGTKEQAFRDYLNQLQEREEYVRPEEAIRGILEAGGIPVLAHPCYGDGDQLILGKELEARVRRLMDFGLQGMECYYSGYTSVLRTQMLELASQLGLYVTAGSDYHGTNKLIPLGDTGRRDGMAPAEGLLRFLEEVPSR